jgi:hypothetical protein
VTSSFSNRSIMEFLSCLTVFAASSCCLLRSSCYFRHSMRSTFIALLISRNTLRFFCSVNRFHSYSCSFIASMPTLSSLPFSDCSSVLLSTLTIRLLQSSIFWFALSLKEPHSSLSPPSLLSNFSCLSLKL